MRGLGFICISEVSLNAAIMMIGLFILRSVYGKKKKKPPNSPSLKGIGEGGGRKNVFISLNSLQENSMGKKIKPQTQL